METKEKELIIKLIKYSIEYGEIPDFWYWLDTSENTGKIEQRLNTISALLKWEVHQEYNPLQDLPQKAEIIDRLLSEASKIAGRIDAMISTDDKQDCWREAKDLRSAVETVFGMALSIKRRIVKGVKDNG